MGSEAQMPRKSAIRTRISQHLGRSGPRWRHVDVDPSALPEAIREADVPATEDEIAEDEDLEQNVLELHALYSMEDVELRSPRRLLGPLVTRIRVAVVGPLRSFFQRQGTFNGAVTRSVSHLRNRSIRHDLMLREGIGNLTPAIRNQAKALHELDRRLRVLERVERPSEHADFDQLAFTKRFRGDQESVRKRQERYVAIFQGAAGPVLDFGCGRGEFLELLGDAGIDSRGVDSDRDMVEHCRAKGLTVVLQDGFTHLEGLPPQSLGGLFASQVVEHLQLPQVLSLVRLARRALRPGSAIVLETHNPQTFATYPYFAIDPTHVRLYHHETVAWFLEQEGFLDVEIKLTDPESDDGWTRRARELGDLGERLTSLLHGYLTYAAVGRVPIP